MLDDKQNNQSEATTTRLPAPLRPAPFTVRHECRRTQMDISRRLWQKMSADRRVLLLLLMIPFLSSLFSSAAVAQTREAESAMQVQGESDPEGKARNTQATVKNPYYNSKQFLYSQEVATKRNQVYVSGDGPRGVDGQFGAVDKIVTGELTNVVFQAAEQGQGNDVQRIARNSLNASLGSINDTYKGLHQWFKDDLVGNLFSNVGQLMGKWLSELINGWIADAVQYLAQFLRVFVLNPNVAVNGLNGQNNDGISPYIRQGADIMYGIAVDLLLLLFILCIWKYWAEASWRGAGNLMGPVGRLIFTAGLLLAWPTIYAFEVQITNEMIKAIYFNSTEELAMLHYALATAVKGGLIAAGAGALTVFAPVLSGGLFGAASPLLGSLFYFASLVVFTILGGVLITELVYLLVLKAVQTALLVAQYMFAPIFLVFFATPDTENIATGYVRAFIETSLWTFVWVGLLRIMVIIIYSNFNPWGKILISIGVLQLMIQVPTFLARAQISPASDFISAGLVTGGLSKALTGLSGALTGGVNTLVGKYAEGKALEGILGTTSSVQTGLGGQAGNPELLNGLNKVSEAERSRQQSLPGQLPVSLASLSPPPAKPRAGTSNSMAGAAMPLLNRFAGIAGGITGGTIGANEMTENGSTLQAKPALESAVGGAPLHKPPAKLPEKPMTDQFQPAGQLEKPPIKPAATHGPSSPTSFLQRLGKVSQSTKAPVTKSGTVTGAPTTPNSPGSNSAITDATYHWQNSAADGWDEKNLVHVPVRKLIGKLTSVDGVGLRTGAKETGILGTAEHGVQRVSLASGASDAEVTRALYSAAFTDQVSTDDSARDAARRSAFRAGAHNPQGFKQSLIANWLESNGKSWYSSPWAKENFARAIFSSAAEGSASYLRGDQGNAYTEYLRGRYGDWDADGKGTREAMAIHFITNPESSESPWNRNIGPATESLVQSGIPISMATRGAMQNIAIQGMHPARRKQAVFAALSYLYPQAKEMYGDQPEPVFNLALGEMARTLPAEQLNAALSMYQISGQADLKPDYASRVNQLASDTGRDIPMAYSSLVTAAPHVARQLGRVRSGTNISAIRTISDLDAVIQPSAGETHQQAFQVVMDATQTAIKSGEMHGIPMRTVLNPDVAPALYEFIGGDVAHMNSASAHRKMQIIARNLGTIGTPNDTRTLSAIYNYVQAGGSLGQMDADHINVTAALIDGGVSGKALPAAVEVALRGGYYSTGGPLPIDEIRNAAHHYSSGQVSDYRFVPVVSQMSQNKMQVSNQSIRIAAQCIADNDGRFDPEHVNAVIRVSQGLRNASFAPTVVETFLRAEAAQQGVTGANELPLSNLADELRAKGTGFDKIASSISSIQRTGSFSDHQLQDAGIVQLMVDSGGGAAPRGLMQAISVVSRVMGSDQVMSNPRILQVSQEYLENNGRARDLDLQPIRCLLDLDARRQSVQQQILSLPNDSALRHDLEAKLSRFRLSTDTLRSVSKDSSYVPGHAISPGLWNKIFH